MSDKKVKLIKEFLSNQEANNLDRSFSELIPKKNIITTSEFFDYYDSLFYDIPQNGLNSHKTLADRSIEYLGNYNDPRDMQILSLNNQINLLNEEINVLRADALQQELADLTYNVNVVITLQHGNWPNNSDRVKDRDRTTHRFIFEDYINDTKYIDNSYNFFKNKVYNFQTTSPTFRIWYSGFNDVKNNSDPVAWRTEGNQIYTIPEGQKNFSVNLKLTSKRAHNASYPPSWTPTTTSDDEG